MDMFLLTSGVTLAALLAGAGILHLLPRLGSPGRRISEAFCYAPWLDLLITYFTVAPLIVGPIYAGWVGLAGGLTGQVLAVMVWTLLHEAANPQARRGPRIVHVINNKVGRFRNHAAVWTTALAVPLFWLVRVAQLTVYPPLTVLVRLPRYRHADWVNVSRHKFKGLVGHDLIWCLYCDWMTGIWSLGSEMLRNVESFWCPIRFASDKKCANCSVDFPDVNNGWVPADGDMQQVADTLDRMYEPLGTARDKPRQNPWFGHPARLTVNGKPTENHRPGAAAPERVAAAGRTDTD